MNYYPHHIGDYKAATAHLSNDEDLAYRRLLDMYYDTEEPIPADTQRVSRRLRLGCDVVTAVLEDFFSFKNDAWHHTRCDMEIREYLKKADTARNNGKKGGRRKATVYADKNPAGSDPVPMANPSPAQALANQEPRTNNQEPVLEKKTPPAKRTPTTKAVIARPDGVDEQTWADWLLLRKTKRAAVTQTVINGATSEAEKAGLSLEDFFKVWCRRGSQGLEASWLRPEERRPQATGETAYQSAQRLKMSQWATGIASKNPNQSTTIDAEASNVPFLKSN